MPPRPVLETPGDRGDDDLGRLGDADEAVVLRRVILRLTVSKAVERGCVSAA